MGENDFDALRPPVYGMGFKPKRGEDGGAPAVDSGTQVPVLLVGRARNAAPTLLHDYSLHMKSPGPGDRTGPDQCSTFCGNSLQSWSVASAPRRSMLTPRRRPLTP